MLKTFVASSNIIRAEQTSAISLERAKAENRSWQSSSTFSIIPSKDPAFFKGEIRNFPATFRCIPSSLSDIFRHRIGIFLARTQTDRHVKNKTIIIDKTNKLRARIEGMHHSLQNKLLKKTDEQVID